MHSERLRLIFQHVFNQISWTWSLPSEDFEIPKQAPLSPTNILELAQRYFVQRSLLREKSSPSFFNEETFLKEIRGLFEFASSKQSKILCCTDTNYPALLRHIPRFPLVLFAKGESRLNHRRLVSIVGSRKATSEALEASYDLGFKLARREFCIVSGGAFGCDAAAHQGAIDSGVAGSTIAVFASGLNQLYPRRLDCLFEDILLSGGSLVSERLPSIKPLRHDFPIRNRIIAGMADELHLMQAGEKSGAMITANLALDYGREVRVWNPCLDDVRFIGNARLLNRGAENSQSTEKTISWDAL